MSTTRSTKARRARLAAVYREAAMRIENNDVVYACWAIGIVSDEYQLKWWFARFFEPAFMEQHGGGAWWSDDHRLLDDDAPAYFAGQTPRVIALLLMAELAEDGQLD